MSDSLLTRIGRSLASGARQVGEWATRVWDGIRSRVKALWGSIRNLFEAEPDEPDEAEDARRAAVAGAIRERFGERPLEALQEATTAERKRMLAEIADRACTALDIPSVDVVVKPMNGNDAGSFSFETRRITVNLGEVDRDPMSADDALELMDTILHEVYHAFQLEAIADRRHRVSSALAETWADEFANYVSASQNPTAYWLQSVEVTARNFAHAVSTSL